MEFEFKFPDVGEGIVEGKLVSWLVKKGDLIEIDQPIAEVETDKAIVEIPSPEKGKILELKHKEGDIIEVGDIIMVLDDEKKTLKESKQDTIENKKEIKKDKKYFNENELNNDKSIENKINIKNNLKKGSNEVNKILTMPSIRHYAKIKNINLNLIKGSGKEGRILKNDLEEQTGHTVMKKIKTDLQKNSEFKSNEILATPSVRKLARELHVDIFSIKGTGDHGHITKEDIKKNANNKKIIYSDKSNVEIKDFEKIPKKLAKQDEEIIPMNQLRLTIAKKMNESKANTVPVTHSDEADITTLYNIRNKEKEILKERGINLTYLPFFVKASLLALKKHPKFNSELDHDNKEILLKKYYNIGFATDTKDGLIVPVLKNVDHKSIIEISNEISLLAQKARERKISVDEISNGTFTLTSVGNIGGDFFTPIINYPQVAILGIGKIKEKPIVIDGKISIRKIIRFSLSFDHRIIDGAEAARFLNTIIKHIEDPNLLFMEMI